MGWLWQIAPEEMLRFLDHRPSVHPQNLDKTEILFFPFFSFFLIYKALLFNIAWRFGSRLKDSVCHLAVYLHGKTRASLFRYDSMYVYLLAVVLRDVSCLFPPSRPDLVKRFLRKKSVQYRAPGWGIHVHGGGPFWVGEVGGPITLAGFSRPAQERLTECVRNARASANTGIARARAGGIVSSRERLSFSLDSNRLVIRLWYSPSLSVLFSFLLCRRIFS